MNKRVTKKYLIDSFVSVDSHAIGVDNLFPADPREAPDSLRAIEGKINGGANRYQCIAITGQGYMDSIRACKQIHERIVERMMISLAEMLEDPSISKEDATTLNLLREIVMNQKLEAQVSILSFYTSTDKNEQFTLEIGNQRISGITPVFMIFTKPNSSMEYDLDLAMSELLTLISMTTNHLKDDDGFLINRRLKSLDINQVGFYNLIVLDDQLTDKIKKNRVLNIESCDKAQFSLDIPQCSKCR